MINVVLILLLLNAVIVILCDKFNNNIYSLVKLYILLLTLEFLVLIIYFQNMNYNFVIYEYNIYLVIIIFSPFVIYMLEMFLLNLIENKIILLDFKYYFRGKLNVIEFLVSSYIAILEEFIFHFFFIVGSNKILLLLLSSILFGIIHSVFSSLNILLKTLFSFVLGYIYIKLDNIYIVIYIHILFNFLAIRHKNMIELV